MTPMDEHDEVRKQKRAEGNLFDVSGSEGSTEELVETLCAVQNIRIERIVSCGNTTPEGRWYDQDWDEWVGVLQGEAVLSYSDGSRHVLHGGDSVFLPSHTRHRVDRTSASPPCVWLAVHVRSRGFR